MDPEGQEPQPQEPPQAPPQAAIPVADLGNALVDAYNKITASQPRAAQVITNALDAMTPEEREALANQALTDPIGAFRRVQAAESRATEQRLMQQAAPLIQTSANTIVELYKAKKQRSDKYFAQVEPLFDRLMIGVDITPLVNMNEATRNHELEMRWKNARSDVLEAEMKRVKPEPTLTVEGGGGGSSRSGKVADDPWMATMSREYGFTKEQLEELEALNG